MNKIIKIIFPVLTILLLISPVLATDIFSNPAEVTVIIRDESGHILKNTSFEVYHQIRDASGELTTDKKVASGNTGDLGRKTVNINVKQFLEKGQGNRFMFKIFTKETKSAPFYFWDNVFTANTFPTKDFRLSSVKIAILKPNKEILENIKFTINTEQFDNECKCVRKKIIHTSTGSQDCNKFHLPEGDYIIDAYLEKGLISSKKFRVNDKQRTNLDYVISVLGLSFRDSNNDVMTKKKFEIYKQSSDIDNNIILGKKIGSYDTGVIGRKELLLNPGVYVVKFSGDKQNFYLYNQEIIESVYKLIDYKLSSLKIVFINEDDGKEFSKISGDITKQELDINDKLITGKKITSFKISKNDFTEFYMPSEKYAAIIKNDKEKDKLFNIEIYENKETKLLITNSDQGLVYEIINPVLGEKDILQIQDGFFAYHKKRLSSLEQEKNQARILKQELENILGKGRIGVSSRNWHILVNSYIYGGYGAEEIADTIKNGPQAVHPEIQACSWRKSKDYNNYLQRKK